MTLQRTFTTAATTLAGLVIAVAVTTASAQPAAQQPGPLAVEPIRSGPVFAPEVKITDVDDITGTLVGGYGGWVTDETFLLGGGGYWLANGSGDLEMVYGGLVIGWWMPAGRAVRFGVRGLVGGGEATLSDRFTFTVPGFDGRPPRPGSMPFGSRPGAGTTVEKTVLFDEVFFVFEPQADLIVRLADWMRLNAGVGYRIVAGADSFDDRLRGVTGSIALQFGGGVR